MEKGLAGANPEGGEEDSAQGHKEVENLFPIFKHFYKDQSKLISNQI
jgi:hypothetical protein